MKRAHILSHEFKLSISKQAGKNHFQVIVYAGATL